MTGSRPTTPVVTFDLFSALLDSRRGGGATFQRLAGSRGWAAGPADVYDHWDRLNKAGQARQARRDPAARWRSFRDLTDAALAETYADLGLDGDAHRDAAALVDEMAHWPLWPGVADGLPVLAEQYRVGLLSNVDDDIAATTAAAPLVDPDLVLTSERLRAYKPASLVYTEARRVVGELVHVATSARDVRGALEAGTAVVRLRRPGHGLDPDGPVPAYQAETVAEVSRLVAEITGFTPPATGPR